MEEYEEYEEAYFYELDIWGAYSLTIDGEWSLVYHYYED